MRVFVGNVGASREFFMQLNRFSIKVKIIHMYINLWK